MKTRKKKITRKSGINLDTIETPALAEVTGEKFDKIRCYTISREVDSSTKHFEMVLRNLKREFGFDIERQTFDVGEL